MKVMDRTSAYVMFEDRETGDKLRVGYDNRGEPYREGVTLEFCPTDRYGPQVFLRDYEVRELRDLLLKLYPVEGRS